MMRTSFMISNTIPSRNSTSDMVVEMEKRGKDEQGAGGELKDQLVGRNGGEETLYYSYYSHNAWNRTNKNLSIHVFIYLPIYNTILLIRIRKQAQ